MPSHLRRSDVSRNDEYNCNACSEPDSSGDMVQCDECDCWLHFTCANVNGNNVDEEPFICANCVSRTSSPPPTIVCELCNKQYNESEVMLCKICLVKLHNLCVTASGGELENQMCKGCVDKKKQHEGTKENDRRENTDINLNNSMSSAAKLRLLQEQEMLMKEKLEAEYALKLIFLQKKHQIIAESNEDNDQLIEPEQPKQSTLVKSATIDSLSNLCKPSTSKLDVGSTESKQLQKGDQNIESKLVPNLHQNKADVISSATASSVLQVSSASVSDVQSTTCNNAAVTIHRSDCVSNMSPNNDANEFQGRSGPLTPEMVAARRAMFNNGLLPFDGDNRKWPIFKANFLESTMYCGFSNAENLDRLQRSLQGKAFTAVKGLLTFADNSPLIMTTLKRRFGKPEIIINSLINQVQDYPAIRIDKLASLVEFSSLVQDLCATINASGLNAHLSNPILVQKIIDKLPAHWKVDWAKYKRTLQNDDGSLKTINDWLMDLSIAVSDVDYEQLDMNVEQPKKTNNKSSGKGYTHASHSSTTETSDSPATNSSTSNVYKCQLCKSNDHTLQKCPKFLSYNIRKRWNIVLRRNICRRCLGFHPYNPCSINTPCGTDGCKRMHHQVMHSTKKSGCSQQQSNGNQNQQPQVQQKEEKSCATGKVTAQSVVNVHKNNTMKVQFRIVPVRLYGNGLYIDSYAFLDEGSSITLIEAGLAKELRLTGKPNSLCLMWTGGVVREEKDSRCVELKISAVSPEATQYLLSNARTVKKLALSPQSNNSHLNSFTHLRGLPIEDYMNVVPRILIGSDNYSLTVPLEVREGELYDPVATRTRLGWVVSGPVPSYHASNTIMSINHHNCIQSDEPVDLHELVKGFFSIENFGVRQNNKVLESNADARARMLLETKTKFNGTRYESVLLWRNDNLTLPNNYTMALKRLICLERKMMKDDTLLQFIKDQIVEYTEQGYIRKLSSVETIPLGQRAWFLPIFVIKNPNKPNKLRIVWDAAATYNGVSLNSMLLTGPQSKNLLVSILYRFREHAVAISGDLKQMFHQVLIRPEDQMSQLFLWRDGDSTRKPDIYVMQVLTFGSTSSPSTAEFCMISNAERCREQFPAAFNSIENNHYVDDWLESFPNEQIAINTINQVANTHKCGGFIMRNWITNSPIVANELNLNQQASSTSFELCEGTQQKVLGMWWAPQLDEFSFKIRAKLINSILATDTTRPTKREVLRLTMSIFDPLGLVGYVVVHLKMFMQRLWSIKLEWDEKIPVDLVDSWQQCVQLLSTIETLSIPRHYNSTRKEPNSIELHIFTDASERVYATVAYLRFVNDDKIHCALVGSKTKVAPNKPISVPRMELLAAVLGARFMKMLNDVHTLNITKQFLWTDSQTVLKWLNSDARQYKQFVALRIGELLDSTNVKQWNWVPSKINIADLATKYKVETNTTNLRSNWFQGPDFLYEDSTQWPTYNVYEPNKSCEIEAIQCSHHDENFDDSEIIVNTEYFSKWTRLKGAQARILWAAKKLRKSNPTQFIKSMTSEWLQRAEILLIRYAQWCDFKKDILALQIINRCNDKSSPLYKLSPFLDEEGVIRLRGRQEYATFLNKDQRFPVLLAPKNHITVLIIRNYHEKFVHQMNETVINEIRQRFYVPRLRAALKGVIKSCEWCKVRSAKPVCPEMSPLPECRMAAYSRAFSHTGIDYFGPLETIHGRKVEKRYGVIFTCMTVRAIHLELAEDLTTSSCILVIRNFLSRRGVPIKFYSDNGTNLRGANTTLMNEIAKIDDIELQSCFQQIKWVTIPPASPHMGGSWERLIRSVKSIIMVVMPTRRPTEQILRSALIEVEGIINSRPLTYIAVDPDAPEALTPNHFLLGSSGGIKPTGEFRDAPEQLRNDWKVSQIIADRFWRRWVLEYLPTLCRRTKWFAEVPNLQLGDFVIIIDENSPRNHWSKAIVQEIHPGRDGRVRSATVSTASGASLKRPVSKLVKLDVARKEISKSTLMESAYGGGNVAASSYECTSTTHSTTPL